MSNPPLPARPRHSVARHGVRRRGLVFRGLVVVIVAAAIGITAVLGGFDQVVDPPAETTTVAVGEEFDGGLWLVTIESAEFGFELLGRTWGDSETMTLQVNATIEILDYFGHGPSEIVQLDAPDGPAPASAEYSLRDGDLQRLLQPRLPARVAFLWEVPAGTAVPTEVTVVVAAARRTPSALLFRGGTFEQPLAPGKVTVPVRDRT